MVGPSGAMRPLIDLALLAVVMIARWSPDALGS
jgi:hypothetical protein